MTTNRELTRVPRFNLNRRAALVLPAGGTTTALLALSPPGTPPGTPGMAGKKGGALTVFAISQHGELSAFMTF